MEPYIEPKQRAGYLKFIAVLFVVAWFVPAMWGMVVGFLVVLVVAGVPIFVGRWLVEKYFEENRNVDKGGDQRADDRPWWLDHRRQGRVRRN